MLITGGGIQAFNGNVLVATCLLVPGLIGMIGLVVLLSRTTTS